MKKNRLPLALLLVFMLSATPFYAQKRDGSKKSSKEQKQDADKKDNDIKSIDEVTKKCKKYPGLFTVFQDTTNGKVFLEIKKDQLDKEYIHFSQTTDGPVDFFTVRGVYSYGKIFTIHRNFDKIELVRENSAFYFDPANALSRAAEANINRPVIYSEKMAAINKDQTTFLIEAEKLFLQETFEQWKPSSDPTEKPGANLKLGSLSKEKSKFIGIKNYEKNSDFQAELVYEESYPINYGDADITDPRFISVKINNSLIELPQNDFEPRFDDPRVGYFGEQVTDMTSTKSAPYRDLISRWHLKKKDTSAALSEPVAPIVWWIENTTPVELREHIRQGVLQWNKAFEKAGFKNAIVVNIQPDNADWDAGDIRYNVLRWTSSPRPPFGGYGPSFINPRTGQILGADVMLEYVFITNRLRESDLFETAAMNMYENRTADPKRFCTIGNHLQRSMMAGKEIINTLGRGVTEENKLLQQAIYMLTLHEVGHTLGLNHNMKASNLHDPVAIHNEKLGREVGLTGSVMDYSNVNIALDPAKQGLYYDVTPGPYDVWAIQFGYSEFAKAESGNKLVSLLSQSAKHELMFGNDADDMRSAGHGIDPRVMIDDMSNDPVAYSIERIQLVNQTLPKLKDKFVKQGDSYQALRNAYFVLTSEIGIGLRIMSRQIGGVYVDRSFAGDGGTQKPFTPVSYQKQKEAMKSIAQYGFSPSGMKPSSDLYSYLQQQRRGFNHFSYNEDPKLHDRMLAIHRDVLNQLLHSATWQRIIDSELYGNAYKLSEFSTDLTESIFKDDLTSSVSYMRQNLQTEYVQHLGKIVAQNSTYNHVSKAVAFAELNNIKKMITKTVSPEKSTKAHRDYLAYSIDRILDID